MVDELSQCSYCAEEGLTESQCVRGDCYTDYAESGSGCGDCYALVAEME